MVSAESAEVNQSVYCWSLNTSECNIIVIYEHKYLPLVASFDCQLCKKNTLYICSLRDIFVFLY